MATAEARQQTASTALPDEVERFTSIAEAWWDPNGDFRPLHQINPARIAYIRDLCAAHYDRDALSGNPLDGLKLLDVGCGGGLLCEPMRRLGADVTGIDAGDKNIAVAQLHAEQGGLDIDYRHQLPEDLAKTKGRFDIVLNMEVVEHVADLGAFLEASASLLKPGGVMVLSTLNRTIKSLALAKIGAEYILRWLPPGTHDWKKFVKPSELAAGIRPHGLDVTDISGMTFRPLKDDWVLTKDLDVNYLMFAVKG
ncbi:MAG: bifunctional 2-polyprenyl-6-hydroxyphenol methylase/3-demethylubiquinol 3-O-methyltransferase UbiG [Alphaproteobacteria bacterium]